MSSEKTEAPTQKRIKDARKEGQTLQSKDFSSAVAHAMYLLAAIVGLPALSNEVTQLAHLVLAASPDTAAHTAKTAYREMFDVLIGAVATFLGIILATIVFTAIPLQSIAFSTKKLVPNLGNISPMKGIKKVFSMNSLLEFIKNLLKISLISTLVYFIASAYLSDISRIPFCSIDCGKQLLFVMLLKLAVAVIAIFLLFGGFDIKLQHALLMKQLKMSKDDVKQEHKNNEGSPEIKGQRRNIANEDINEDDLLQNTAFGILAPGNSLIFMYYDKNAGSIPIVIHKLNGPTVQRMAIHLRQMKRPVFRRPNLANKMMAKCKVMEPAPQWTFGELAQMVQSL